MVWVLATTPELGRQGCRIGNPNRLAKAEHLAVVPTQRGRDDGQARIRRSRRQPQPEPDHGALDRPSGCLFPGVEDVEGMRDLQRARCQQTQQRERALMRNGNNVLDALRFQKADYAGERLGQPSCRVSAQRRGQTVPVPPKTRIWKGQCAGVECPVVVCWIRAREVGRRSGTGNNDQPGVIAEQPPDQDLGSPDRRGEGARSRGRYETRPVDLSSAWRPATAMRRGGAPRCCHH